MSGEAPKALRAITQTAADIARRQKALDERQEALEQALVAEYEAGTTVATLAAASGYSDPGVRKILRRRGVEIRPRGRRPMAAAR